MPEIKPTGPKQQNITDRVLHVLQTRFPNEFEIAVLTAQNEVLVERINELDWEIDLDADESEVVTE
jgi:hypothetical protein